MAAPFPPAGWRDAGTWPTMAGALVFREIEQTAKPYGRRWVSVCGRAHLTHNRFAGRWAAYVDGVRIRGEYPSKMLAARAAARRLEWSKCNV